MTDIHDAPNSDIVKHPAKFSDSILETIAGELFWELADRGLERIRVLDPFAGVGRVHELADEQIETVGIELEPEWAAAHPSTLVGDARNLPFERWSFDAIVTSPTYGNRMADHHEARDESKRMTYRHVLGRPLTEGNSGAMQWGDAYRSLHVQAWREARRVLCPGGIFVLNASNHIRKKAEVRVVEWHVSTLERMGFVKEGEVLVPTRRMGFGANAKVRVDGEKVVLFRRS